MAMKKINPRRQPVNQAQINREINKSTTKVINYCWTLMFTVLLDKYDFPKSALRGLWDETEKLAGSIKDGYVSLADLKNVLKTEYDIDLE
jgi:hypothetical protein